MWRLVLVSNLVCLALSADSAGQPVGGYSMYESMAGGNSNPTSGSDYQGKEQSQLQNYGKAMHSTFNQYIPTAYSNFASQPVNARVDSGGNGADASGEAQTSGSNQGDSFSQYMQLYGGIGGQTQQGGQNGGSSYNSYYSKYLQNSGVMNLVEKPNGQSTDNKGSYGDYMKKYAGKYTGGGYEKYLQNFQKASSSGNYADYASEYTKGGSYDKYVDKYGGSNAEHYLQLYTKSKHGGYQKYMNQYAGKGGYQKYMNQYAGGSDSSSKYSSQYGGGSVAGTDTATQANSTTELTEMTGSQSQQSSDGYDSYMQKYAGGSSGGYEKYMKQYAGGSGSQGSGSQGSYQKYMDQYADKYAGKYMKQYADKYMNQKTSDSSADQSEGASQVNTTLDLTESGDSTSETGSDGYQKYMKQYAGGGGSQGGYQKYMKQYADKYAGKYMKQYAGKYMGQHTKSSDSASQGNTTLDLTEDSAADSQGGYQKYMNQYAGSSGGYDKYMKQYAGGGGSQGGYQKYMKQYAGGNGGYQKYMKQYTNNNYQQTQTNLNAIPQPQDAKSKDDLDKWKEAQYNALGQYVPAPYVHFAHKTIDAQYEQRLKELQNTTGHSEQDSEASEEASEDVINLIEESGTKERRLSDVPSEKVSESQGAAKFLAQRVENSSPDSHAVFALFAWAGGALALVTMYVKFRRRQISESKAGLLGYSAIAE